MGDGTRVASVEDVPERGSYLFTVRDDYGDEREVILVPCERDSGVEAWINNCTHESQRFDRGSGAPMRDGETICPKQGSVFDACSGACDNGEAAGTALPAVEIAVEGGAVLLTDDDYAYPHESGIGDGEDRPSSTSHIGF